MARLHPARRTPKEEGWGSYRTKSRICRLGLGPESLWSYERRDELQHMVLDELRVDLRERIAAGRARHRARLRQRAVHDGHGLVVVARVERELALRRVARRGAFQARGRDAQADRRFARRAVGLEDELLLADDEGVAARPEHLSR